MATHWPIIADALDARSLYERDIARAVIATVAIETGGPDLSKRFTPVREAYWMPESWRQANHRYYPHDGRGYIQLTWESNYRAAGEALGIDLLSQPDRAMEPETAARVLAWFWATQGVKSKDGARWFSLPELCRLQDWEWVRRVVQGGTAGLDRFTQIITSLGDAPVQPTPLPFNPDAPIDQQPDPWSCALQSIQWLLRTIGRNPDASDPTGDPWLRSQLVPALISPDVGLRDGSGKQLAAWVNREYGAEMGFMAQASSVTFDDVMAGAGTNPMIVGGHKWGAGGHWAGVRRADGPDALLLANPANGYTGIQQRITRTEWNNRGPWDCIWIDRMSAIPAPEPPAPPAVTKAQVIERLRGLQAMLDAHAAAEKVEMTVLLEMADRLEAK